MVDVRNWWRWEFGQVISLGGIWEFWVRHPWSWVSRKGLRGQAFCFWRQNWAGLSGSQDRIFWLLSDGQFGEMSSSLKFDIEPTLFHQVKRGFGDLVLTLTTPPLPEVQVLGKFLRWLALLQFPVRKATLRAAWGCPEGGPSYFFLQEIWGGHGMASSRFLLK